MLSRPSMLALPSVFRSNEFELEHRFPPNSKQFCVSRNAISRASATFDTSFNLPTIAFVANILFGVASGCSLTSIFFFLQRWDEA